MLWLLGAVAVALAAPYALIAWWLRTVRRDVVVREIERAREGGGL